MLAEKNYLCGLASAYSRFEIVGKRAILVIHFNKLGKQQWQKTN